jgi:hypothetical protein
MKVVGFVANGETRLGVVDGDQVVDLKAADEKAPTDLNSISARRCGGSPRNDVTTKQGRT